MHIYLVRHGETTLNKEKIHQTRDTLLSEKGLSQAKFVAGALKDVEINKIYVSPLERAKQTAKEIYEATQAPIITSEALKEIVRPSVIVGRKHNDPDVLAVKKQLRESYHLTDWHHSDEENFLDLKSRVGTFKNTLEKYEDQNVVLVSHGMFIKMFISLVIFGDQLQPRQFLDFYDRTLISNGSISYCIFDPEDKWKLICLNDTNHVLQLEFKNAKNNTSQI